ncbi:hypothetical protein [Marinicella meishanensis]|uniref:hypothetical protein n=1 Tax=Marinicella meishanensis TaxID=2873263 RepID=UPI001CBFD8E8|nr:hypothetical protein [Marinicella sp. NBU2979]
MKAIIYLRTGFLLAVFSATYSATSLAAPDYANDQTKQVIEAMVTAHGGLEKWRAAPAISFDAIMHNNYHGKNELAWWVARETFDQQTKQVHQDWYMNDAEIAFDGTTVWSRNWQKANPPTAMLYFFYYFVNLPWLTQEDGVVLSAVNEFAWPGHGGKTYHEVKMTFKTKPTIGKSDLDYFVLYIDPATHLLAGYQYAVGNKALLKSLGQPPERELFGPLWRLITKHQTVDGLVFPAAFRTMPEADERIVGNHIITHVDVRTPLDPSKLIQPAGAKVDPEANR